MNIFIPRLRFIAMEYHQTISIFNQQFYKEILNMFVISYEFCYLRKSYSFDFFIWKKYEWKKRSNKLFLFVHK